jgi:hypothetical protein
MSQPEANLPLVSGARTRRAAAVEVFGDRGVIALNDDHTNATALELYSIEGDGLGGHPTAAAERASSFPHNPQLAALTEPLQMLSNDVHYTFEFLLCRSTGVQLERFGLRDQPTLPCCEHDDRSIDSLPNLTVPAQM